MIIKNIKIFFLFFILLFNFWLNNVSANENLNPIISNISYDWFLNNNTLIKITWENLKDCNLLSINNKKINYKNNNGIFTFKFNDLWKQWLNWNIKMICNKKIIYKEYSIPYINNIKITDNSNNKTIIINWKNITNNNSDIYIWTTQLSIIEKNNWSIIAKLPNKINNSNIYIDYNWLKSNIIPINIISPTIDYIESDNWFQLWTTLKIYFKNFPFWIKNSIILNNKKYNILKADYFKNYIVFKLPKDIKTENTLLLDKNWFISNQIIFNLNFPIPKITNILTWIDKNWNQILKILWNNFINKNITKVYYKNLNSEDNKDIISINSNEIIIKRPNIIDWNNMFFIINNKKSSNIYNYFIPFSATPFISDLKIEGLSPDYKKRIIRLTVNNFNKKTDKILLNWNEINNFWYYWNILKFQLDKNITKWVLTFKRKNNIIKYIKTFNFSFDKYPAINYIQVLWDYIPWTKVIINWKNFSLSQIQSTNFLAMNNDTNSLDIEITDNKITWRISNTFNKNNNSSISIENNWLNTNLSFIANKIKSKLIYWKIILKWIFNKNNKIIIKQGDTIKIIWNYFHLNDKLFINNKKVLFKLISPIEISAKLDSNINTWINTIKIINNQWVITDLWKIIIFWKNTNPDIIINQEKTDNNIIYNPITQILNKKLKLKYQINNKISNIQINKITFKVINYDKKNNLGYFTLIYNWNEIWSNIINSKWFIEINNPFILKKDLTNLQTLELNKDDNYIIPWNYKIELYSINATYKINWIEKKYNNIIINNIDNPFIIKTQSINQIKNCINSKNEIYNCNNIKNLQKNNNKNINTNININNIKNIINPFNNKKRLELIRLYANSKHKLNNNLKWKKYIIAINNFINKYSQEKNILTNTYQKVLKIKEKIQDKTWIKYYFLKNILNYLEAKIWLQLLIFNTNN